MSAIVALDELLKSMSPEIQKGEYVFCTLANENLDYKHLNPLATFKESEGLTLIIPVESAVQKKLAFEGIFKQITLTVHSSLEAVGLTAAVTNKLASYGISANVIAAFYHDYVFVQTEKAEQALSALNEFRAELNC
ncbi:transporter [Desulfobacter hydrogenophilus]|uniref:ACT domain-containing protein n=1 Tax=Desulfobacter hydrogenophilus TaxID=2291 RepID=A0A328FK04_9BACT|nr:ACT domain-containing protein [Desulfobacter hydrogenophilus]NDY70675.1 ACT domain-containing protein [Desulfobacter hydrogenophilus]QBH12706.1 ACT domain-containing protein [Desulfobacter hydrogenophilus]RAM03327.1 transporter [Desulfobacter hydrogenophilus]